MRRWSRWVHDDSGSALLEFLVLGTSLLVPLVYLILTLGAVQEQTLGAEAAARHTARAVGLAEDRAQADAAGAAVLREIVDQYGMDPDAVHVSLSCAPADAPCPSAGATVTVEVRTRVSLPFVPPVLGLAAATSIPVEASAVQRLSRTWSAH